MTACPGKTTLGHAPAGNTRLWILVVPTFIGFWPSWLLTEHFQFGYHGKCRPLSQLYAEGPMRSVRWLDLSLVAGLFLTLGCGGGGGGGTSTPPPTPTISITAPTLVTEP